MELQMLRLGDACEALRMSPNTLKKYERLGLIKPTRDLGGYRRFPIEEIRRFREMLIARTEGEEQAAAK
jgi:DNA-binding transcriptional MerR regulator